MRLILTYCAIAIAIAAPASAQVLRFWVLGTGGSPMCVDGTRCDASTDCLGTMTSGPMCMPFAADGGLGGSYCSQSEPAVCCSDVCPVLGNDCVQPSDGSPGICIDRTRHTYCGTSAVEWFQCHEGPAPDTRFPVLYDNGDCDRDGIPNRSDMCLCVHGSTAGMGCPVFDAGVVRRPDAGTTTTFDATIGPPADAGNPTTNNDAGNIVPPADSGFIEPNEDAGMNQTQEDASAPAVDAGGEMGPFDGGLAQVRFGGGGGCACRASLPSRSPLAALTILLALTIFRRASSRARRSR